MPNDSFDDVDYSIYRYNVKKHKKHKDKIKKEKNKVNNNDTRTHTHARERGVKIDKQGLFVSIMLLVCFSVTFVLIGLIQNNKINVSSIFKKQSNKDSYYAVCIGKYADEGLAFVSADELRKTGGAGYPLYKSEIYIVINVYKDRNDAEKIKKRLDNSTSFVYEIKDTPPLLDWCKNENKDTILKVLGYRDMVYQELYNISNLLQQGNISELIAKNQIKTLLDSFNKLTAVIDDINLPASNVKLIRLKSELLAVHALLDNLTNDYVKRYNLLSDIRYTMVAVIDGYKKLTVNI